MDRTSRFWKDTGGTITAITAISLIAFVGALAFVVDLGHLHIVQNELRNAADTCALRGARAFLPDVLVPGPPPYSPWTGDQMNANARAQATDTVSKNKSDNTALKDLPDADIQTGIWYYKQSEIPGGSSERLQPWTWPPPASEWGKFIGPGIRLPVKRDGSDNYGPVGMTLASFLGQKQVSVGARATAALSGVGGFVPGSPVLPFGTWGDLLTGIGQVIEGKFKPDANDKLGWTNLDPNDTNPNASELKKMIRDATGQYTPDCPTGSSVGIQNGVDASVIGAMTGHNNRFGLAPSLSNPDIYVPTGTNASGVPYADVVYMMPVFEDNGSGDKFNQSAVVGAVPVKIVQVQTSPVNSITVKVVDDYYPPVPGYGGGRYYGILSPQPFLVE
ncbi:MAG: Tad domain-containing protein [Deltaproteobacteria bacterium]|nr:Tad domain-containing protein [Deltaproteobacteria bacterium]